MSTINVHVQMLGGRRITVTVSPQERIQAFKERIQPDAQISAAQQRLIHRGHVLIDSETLASSGVEDGHIIHLVRGSAPAPTPAAAAPNPFGAFSGGGMPEMDPEMMRSMMDSPMMRSMMDNPEIMRGILTSNPQMRQLMETRPEIAQLLNDPAMLRQSMQMMRNPDGNMLLMRLLDFEVIIFLSALFVVMRQMQRNQEVRLYYLTPATTLCLTPAELAIDVPTRKPPGRFSTHSAHVHGAASSPGRCNDAPAAL